MSHLLVIYESFTRALCDLEKAIGFCLRKGKAGGEPSPTERYATITDICVGLLPETTKKARISEPSVE
jgi:hypothetical protein